MKRLVIKSEASGIVYNINLDSVAFYEVKVYDGESGAISVEFFFNNSRRLYFICYESDLSAVHNALNRCANSDDDFNMFIVEKEI